MNKLQLTLLPAIPLILLLGSTHVMAEKVQPAPDLKESITNARQEAQIWTTYALSPYLSASNISVTVVNGEVTLTGNLEESSRKELAGAIANGVSGITAVDNQISIDPEHSTSTDGLSQSYSERVQDATISTAVKSKLLWSKHTEGMDTKVSTQNGKVELSGTVANDYAKQQAEKLAKDTDGVRSVTNNLQVSDKVSDKQKNTDKDQPAGTMIADSWITTKVKSTLLYSSNVSGSDISVNTDKGIVTLAGKVNSGIEQALAIELTQNIRGVKSVTSKQLVY